MKRKVSKTDFTNESLPKTRREQYFQIVKDNFPLLFKIGLICLLFLTPFIITFFLKESYLRGISNDSSLNIDEQKSLYLSFEMIFNAIYIACTMIFFIGFGGILKIVRRLIWNEPIFFKEDFFLGIKENIVQFLLIGFVIGALNFSYLFLYRMLDESYRYISYILAGLSLAIITPIFLLTGYISSIYSNKFKTSMNVSSRLFLRRGILFLLPILLIYALYFISIIPLGTVYLTLIYIFVFVFFVPFIILFSYILTFKILDDYINAYYYPDRAYLGLYISKEKQALIEQKVIQAKQEKDNENEE